jgi:hypothetical protein
LATVRALPLLLALALAATPAAAFAGESQQALVVTGALAGGAEITSGESDGLAEVEVGVGWELGEVRPELGLLFGLTPGTYAGVRPGVHVAIPGGPFYARGAFDWAHQGGDWHFRWLVAGAGAELRLTSVMSGFVEVDAGIPLTSSRGLGLLARAGFAFRP